LECVSVLITAYVYALAMAGHSMNFLPEQKYSKRTKRWYFDS